VVVVVDVVELADVVDVAGVVVVADVLDVLVVLVVLDVLDVLVVLDVLDMLDDAGVVDVAKVVELFAVGLQEHAELYRAVAVPQPPVARAGKPVVAVLIVVVYVAQNASADDRTAGL